MPRQQFLNCTVVSQQFFSTFICIDLLLLIWDAFYNLDLLVKFAFAELILVLLQFVVSKIFAAQSATVLK